MVFVFLEVIFLPYGMVKQRFLIFSAIAVLLCVAVFVLPYVGMANVIPAWVVPAQPSLVATGNYLSCVTSIFLHSSIFHLVNNMLSLLWVGMSYERHEGHIKFILVFLLTGMAGAWWYCYTQAMAGLDVGVVGASGAIFGLFGAYIVILVRYLFVLDSLDPSRLVVSRSLSTLIKVLVWNIAYGFFMPGIANEAHLGGFVAGLVLGFLFLLLDTVFGRWRRMPDASSDTYENNVSANVYGGKSRMRR